MSQLLFHQLGTSSYLSYSNLCENLDEFAHSVQVWARNAW